MIMIIGSVIAFLASTACQAKERLPNRYLIPDRYVGWVRVNYRIKDAPVIPIESGYYLFRFPESGLINTSIEGEEGAAVDEYYYYWDDKRRVITHTGDNRLIWGEVGFGSDTIRGQAPTRYEYFFVGTREDYEHIGIKCKNNENNLIIGRIEKCPSAFQGEGTKNLDLKAK